MVTATPANTRISIGDRDIARLRMAFHGRLILPQDAAYETARRVWNGAIDRHPALIVRCADAGDIRYAVEFARQSHLDISIRGGGHSWPGFSTCDGGLVIDLSPMKRISVDPEARTARAEPGVTLGELIHATQAHGLVINTGGVSDTGIAGLTLGGGMGLLMGKYGLTCDNVRSFDVVTADGRLLRADANENVDLYWALRGGGGNFGIVTAFEYQLHNVGTFLGGKIVYPLSRAREVYQLYRDLMPMSPDELSAMCDVLPGPDGAPSIGIIIGYCGDPAEGERWIAPLRRFGSVIFDNVKPRLYGDLFEMLDRTYRPGRHYHGRGSGIPELNDRAIDTLVESANSLTSPFSQVLAFYFHGAAARVGVGETAFAYRENHYEIIHLAAWEDDAEDKHVQWMRRSWQALRPFAGQRVYVNFLDDEGTARVRDVYGANYERLVALKEKYDPNNVFHLNQNIKPTVLKSAR